MHSTKPEASFGQAHTDPVINQQQMMLAGNNMGPSNGTNNTTNMAASIYTFLGPDSLYTFFLRA
jgi:hypothetical protein